MEHPLFYGADLAGFSVAITNGPHTPEMAIYVFGVSQAWPAFSWGCSKIPPIIVWNTKRVILNHPPKIQKVPKPRGI